MKYGLGWSMQRPIRCTSTNQQQKVPKLKPVIFAVCCIAWLSVWGPRLAAEEGVASGDSASGLADLQNALRSFSQSAHPASLKGDFSVDLWRLVDHDGDEKLIEGQAVIYLELEGQELSVRYPAELLARIKTEEDARAKNPNALTPTLDVLWQLDVTELRRNLAAVDRFNQALAQAEFISESQDSYKGILARRLEFTMGEEVLSDQDKKYVKDFDVRLVVWIDDAGIPIASKVTGDIKGSAFIVIKFSSYYTDLVEYKVHNGSLVAVYKEYKGKSKNPREKRQETITKQLYLKP